jgi:hypothetical protein
VAEGMTGSRFLVCALLAAALAAAPGGAAAKTKIFSSGLVNKPIPDAVGSVGIGIEDFLQIKKRGRVKDVDVSVRITHPNTTDLELDLTRLPAGALLADHYPKDGVALSADFGAGAPACAGAVFTTFDDEASASITGGTNPFAGAFQPVGPRLSELDGVSLKGKWRLGLLDGSTGSAGVLNCWQVRVRYKPARGRGRR